MMKKSMLAVALLMVGGAAVAGDADTATGCSHKSMVGRAACGVKHYGYTVPAEYVVKPSVDYAWHGKHSGTTVTTWLDRGVRFTGLWYALTYGVVPATSYVYKAVAAQVKTLKADRK
ncbi:MAG: hypothetical protein ACHQVS_00875 [Candidatus Babeliales bacterium]